jgi:hypothetical protein
MGGIISPVELLLIIAFYLALVITAIYLVMKNERNYHQPLWVMIILLFPFFGSLIYLARHFLTRPSKNYQG